jgi:predicted nucleic acid-binding Zn ribbon protein
MNSQKFMLKVKYPFKRKLIVPTSEELESANHLREALKNDKSKNRFLIVLFIIFAIILLIFIILHLFFYS